MDHWRIAEQMANADRWPEPTMAVTALARCVLDLRQRLEDTDTEEILTPPQHGDAT